MVTEETPGIGIIGIFFETHSLISILPGSEITGVPASEIRAVSYTHLTLPTTYTV